MISKSTLAKRVWIDNDLRIMGGGTMRAICGSLRFASSALVVLALTSVPTWGQETTLAADSEANGAVLAAGPITFQRDGSIGRATLKTDFVRDGLTYQAGSVIEFFSDGRVSRGQLAAAAPFGPDQQWQLLPGPIQFYPNGGLQSANMKAGSRDANVELPVDMSVNLTIDRRFGAMSPLSSAGLQYRFWGRTLRNGQAVTFVYDRIAERYVMTRGMAGAPQLAGTLVTGRDAFRLPTTVVPIVVPTLSTFNFHSRNIDYAANASDYDEWYYEGVFTINGYNFGLRPRLYFVDSRLARIQLSQSITIDGVAYVSGAVISLNDVGKIVK